MFSLPKKADESTQAQILRLANKVSDRHLKEGRITAAEHAERLVRAEQHFMASHKAPDSVLNEPIRAIKDGQLVEHTNPNTSFLGHDIKYRHDIDRVLANLRKWDVTNPDKSLKMKWLKDVYPEKSPEQIYDLANKAKGGLYAGVSRLARDNNPRGAVKLDKADLDYSLHRLGEGAKSKSVVGEMRARVEDSLRRFGFKGKIVVDNRENFPPETHGAHPNAEGFITPDGTLYIDAAKNNSHADAIYTAFHEAYHRGELGSEAKPYADALERAGRNGTVRALADEIKATYKSHGIELEDSRAVREALADIHGAQKTGRWDELNARNGGRLDVSPLAKAQAYGIVKRVIDSLKRVFTKAFNRPMTDREVTDLVNNTFKKSSEPVQTTSKEIDSLSLHGKGGNEGILLKARNKVLDRQLAEGKITEEEHAAKMKEAQAKFGAKSESIAKANSVESIAHNALELAKDTSRAFKLSGLLIAPKLLGAVGWKLVLSPAEQAVISAMRIIPAIDRIAQGAKRYSGFNSEAEWKALKDTFSMKTLQQMKQAATKGNIDIDKFRELAHVAVEDVGNEAKLDRPVRDFVTRLHAALKTPLKINEFSRSTTLRTQAEIAENIANGMTPKKAVEAANSVEAQSRIGVEAYIDAQRAVMLGDNKLHNAIEYALRTAKESDSIISKTVAHSVELLTPVRKVPLNIGAEALEYAAGGFNAGVKILKHGVEKLTSQERDYVLRNLSKQTIGLVVGYLAVKGLIGGGGYFTGDKRDYTKGQIHPLDMEFFGHKFPHSLIHTPALDIVQAIANFQKLKSRNESSGEAAAHTAEGFAKEHAPMFSLADEFIRAMAESHNKNPTYQSKADKMMDNIIKGFVIPGAVSSAAVMKDNYDNPDVTERKSTDLKTVLQKGIPGYREDLPAYKD